MKSLYKSKLYKISFLIAVTILYTLLFSLSCNVLKHLGILSIKADDILFLEIALLNIGSLFVIFEIGQSIEFKWFRNYRIPVSILIGFSLGLLASFLSYIYAYLPTLLNKSIIGIGSNQKIVTYDALSFEHFLVTSTASVVLEELLFRVLFFWCIGEVIKIIYKFLKKDIKNINVFNIKSKEGLIALLISSTIFALGHGFSLVTFPIYFIPGLTFGYLYSKFGLASSIVAHSAGNYFTDITHIIVSIIFS